MTEPSFTDFETALDKAADPIFRGGKTGYQWGPVDKLLKEELNLDGQIRCKKATGSGRAANVLTESNDKIIELYVIFIGPHYSRAAFLPAAADRIKRFPNVRTVAVADHVDGRWRVRAIIEREGVGLAEEIRGSFPAVTEADVHEIKADFEAAEAEGLAVQPPAVPAVDPDEFASAMLDYHVELDGLANLPEHFVQFAAARGVVLDATTAIDLLASTLSSQLVLFAGPSGTGKSTYARLIQQFFAADVERAPTFEAQRQWLSPDDLVGYYSVLGDQFATTPDTQKLIDLHEASIAPLLGSSSEIAGPPVLLVEEINLSAPEGYLAPIVHGLSGVSTPFLYWSLHSRATGAVDQASVLTLPETAMIGPYPRVLGTINVDATAHAPARKVAARSCVVLLEPQMLTKQGLSTLVGAAIEPDSSNETGPAAAFLGDPLAALKGLKGTETDVVAAALLAITPLLGGALVSRRDAIRCLAYMAYFRCLAPDLMSGEQVLRLAAENAILHCVLPTVDADHFVSALQVLEATALCEAASDDDIIGGLLATRVEKLLEIATSGLGIAAAIDYWAALS